MSVPQNTTRLSAIAKLAVAHTQIDRFEAAVRALRCAVEGATEALHAEHPVTPDALWRTQDALQWATQASDLLMGAEPLQITGKVRGILAEIIEAEDDAIERARPYDLEAERARQAEILKQHLDPLAERARFERHLRRVHGDVLQAEYEHQTYGPNATRPGYADLWEYHRDQFIRNIRSHGADRVAEIMNHANLRTPSTPGEFIEANELISNQIRMYEEPWIDDGAQERDTGWSEEISIDPLRSGWQRNEQVTLPWPAWISDDPVTEMVELEGSFLDWTYSPESCRSALLGHAAVPADGSRYGEPSESSLTRNGRVPSDFDRSENARTGRLRSFLLSGAPVPRLRRDISSKTEQPPEWSVCTTVTKHRHTR